MQNFAQHGDNLTLPAPYTVGAGGGVLVGNIFGVAIIDGVGPGFYPATAITVATRGVFTLPKVTALAIATGARVYWDNAAKLVTTVTTSNTLIGVAVTDAANPSGAVNVRLNGSF